MKNILKSKFLWVSALMLAMGFAGCNLFNPTESVDIKGNDADALTYEGYLKFRNNEYTEAEYYFRRAIFADSSHSEAWYGLMKSILNRKLAESNETNLFSLLKYTIDDRSTGGTNNPVVKMPDEVAKRLKPVIDSVNIIAKQFIEREKKGLTDGIVTYKTISEGYMVLQLLKTIVVAKEKMPADCMNTNIKKAATNCDYATVLNKFKNDPGETVETFNEFFSTCEENPEAVSNYFDNMLQGFDNLKEEAQRNAVSSLCAALAKQTADAAGNEKEQKKSLNAIISQMAYSDVIDDDGDGCIDEEVYDGEDNDGDGEVDEDVTDRSNLIDYDETLMLQNIMAKKKTGQEIEIKDLQIVIKARPYEKYRTVDIDMNGRTVAKDGATEEAWEWDFFRGDYANRKANSYFNEATQSYVQGDHRFNYASQLKWNPMQLDPATFRQIKDSISLVNIPAATYEERKLDWQYRKTHIGGCWANYVDASGEYDDKKYLGWFEGRVD